MNFSPQQERALDAVATWLKSSEQVFRLFGYAGTGKTTLARHLGADHYAAFTGKAAYVMREKGCAEASTIHSLIYIPREKSKLRLQALLDELAKDPDSLELQEKVRAERAALRRPSFTLNVDSDLRRSRLLVIDECSMVDEQIGRDLLSFGCKILVLGDPAQLPPVYGGGFFTAQTPDVLLTEVHRQARDNPILDLATFVRENRRLPAEHSLLRRGIRASEEMLLGVDQLIVGRNATRRALNQKMRGLLGLDAAGPLPCAGDRVVCLRNNHELDILNGALYDVTDTIPSNLLELDGHLLVAVHPEPFRGEEVNLWRLKDAEMFDYGYALTCHKAQGSQWDSVGVFDESAAFREHRTRWLYTAVTRAARELWVVTS